MSPENLHSAPEKRGGAWPELPGRPASTPADGPLPSRDRCPELGEPGPWRAPPRPSSSAQSESSAQSPPYRPSTSSTSLELLDTSAFLLANWSLRTVVKSEVASGGRCRPLRNVSSSWYCSGGNALDVSSSTSLDMRRRAAEAWMRRCARADAREDDGTTTGRRGTVGCNAPEDDGPAEPPAMTILPDIFGAPAPNSRPNALCWRGGERRRNVDENATLIPKFTVRRVLRCTKYP